MSVHYVTRIPVKAILLGNSSLCSSILGPSQLHLLERFNIIFPSAYCSCPIQELFGQVTEWTDVSAQYCDIYDTEFFIELSPDWHAPVIRRVWSQSVGKWDRILRLFFIYRKYFHNKDFFRSSPVVKTQRSLSVYLSRWLACGARE